MEEQELHQQVKEIYQEINNKWMQFHLHLLVLCALLSMTLEVLAFFIISANNALSHTVGLYWIKYIGLPGFLVILIILAGFLVYESRKASIAFKQYMISFLFGILAFVLSFMHSGFVAVLVCAIFPVIMTIMYENQKLTAITAAGSVVSQIISGFFLLWDPDKVLNYSYFVNMAILTTAVFGIWCTCYFMMKFMNMKREIIINNDIERYHLKERVSIDSLTNVGNKHALMQYLAEVSVGTCELCYLAMIDIDDFKRINDNDGHVFGDKVLQRIGDGMRKIQVGARAFRYGGDEFCILFTEPSLDAVIREVEAIQEYLSCMIDRSNQKQDIFISTGITQYSSDKTPTKLLQQADTALYVSKRRAGSQITVFQEEHV